MEGWFTETRGVKDPEPPHGEQPTQKAPKGSQTLFFPINRFPALFKKQHPDSVQRKNRDNIHPSTTYIDGMGFTLKAVTGSQAKDCKFGAPL
jgi:hypothetical protein